MKAFQKFFFLTALVALFSASFLTEAQAQTRREAAPAMVFNAEKASQWHMSRIPSRVPDGETVLATYKRDRTQIIARVRGGKIVQVGYKPIGKSFTALPQRANPCISTGMCFSFQVPHCFTMPWGECVCICGAWISAG